MAEEYDDTNDIDVQMIRENEMIRQQDEARADPQHTPEPWHNRADDFPGIVRSVGGGSVANCDSERGVYHADTTGDNGASNAARIVQCVNAMAGIPDPAALVKSHGELEEACKDARTALFMAPESKFVLQVINRIEAALANAAAIKGEKK